MYGAGLQAKVIGDLSGWKIKRKIEKGEKNSTLSPCCTKLLPNSSSSYHQNLTLLQLQHTEPAHRVVRLGEPTRRCGVVFAHE